MQSPTELRAKARQIMAEAASETDRKTAGMLRDLALSIEQIAKQREMATDGTKAIVGGIASDLK